MEEHLNRSNDRFSSLVSRWSHFWWARRRLDSINRVFFRKLSQEATSHLAKHIGALQMVGIWQKWLNRETNDTFFYLLYFDATNHHIKRWDLRYNFIICRSNVHGWKKSTTNRSFSFLTASNVLSVNAGTKVSGTTVGFAFRTASETSSSSVSSSEIQLKEEKEKWNNNDRKNNIGITQRSEETMGRRDERTKERWEKETRRRRDEGTKGRRDEGKKGRRDEEIRGRRDEGTKGRRDEETKR